MKKFLQLLLLTACGSLHAASPYAGEEQRDIKSLSDADIQGYLAGNGMGLAKAAELNGYPGPLHVLELAEQLGLNADQVAQSRAVYATMKARAMTLGEALVVAERQLDRQFADGSITADSLKQSLEHIAGLRGDLRRTHLEAHLDQTRVLTDAQVARYFELRGYHSMDHGSDHSAHAHH